MSVRCSIINLCGLTLKNIIHLLRLYFWPTVAGACVATLFSWPLCVVKGCWGEAVSASTLAAFFGSLRTLPAGLRFSLQLVLLFFLFVSVPCFHSAFSGHMSSHLVHPGWGLSLQSADHAVLWLGRVSHLLGYFACFCVGCCFFPCLPFLFLCY